MHMLFVDESGTPPHPQKVRDRYFVIGGAIIPEGCWHSLKNALLGMKARRQIRGEIKWRFFAPGNVDASNPMRHLEAGERDQIRSEVYEAICAHPQVRVLACVASIEAAYKLPAVKSPEDLYQATYKPVTERFQYYLQDLGSNPSKHYGVIIADHRGPKDDLALRRHHQRLLHSGSEFTSKYENLIESLFTQPSNMSVGVQLADMVAGAVWRKFERGDSRWFDMLEPAFRRSLAGTVEGYGLIKFPKTGWT